jgi:hypothetical protein
MSDRQDLVRFGLREPRSLTSLTLKEWDLLIQESRRASMLGRIHALLVESGSLENVPEAPRAHLKAAHVVAASQERLVRWEVYCIQRVLSEVEPGFVLLKGSAYILSGMPFARGRLQSDVDILVPKSRLDAVEKALLDNGWKHMKLEKYDQRFYRQWSHELPPLVHAERRTVLDVHHNILPVTGRLHPNASKLLQRVTTIEGTTYRRLCGADMVLHTAAHLFQDGDLHQGLRELADVDGLLRYFSAQHDFWDDLILRAPEMDLQRPLFYALRYCRSLLGTPIPDSVVSASKKWSQSESLTRVMDYLVSRAVAPHRRHDGIGKSAAHWLMYVRSHWLRMPPTLLVQHLLHKALRKRFSD